MRLDPIDILIADDDDVLLETVAETLESLGGRPEKAHSGQEAIDLIGNRQATGKNFDVIILDWKMKGLDGVETAKKIRGEFGATIPIIMTSAYDLSDIETAAKDAGVNGFMGKPLFPSTLFTAINELRGVEAKAIEPEDDYSDIAGLNILIAEDNEINWEIIHALLEMFGITSERAVNGKVCVERLSNAKDDEFDLIFMDIQMPEMNGLDATRTIRKFENAKKANLPIIAMTADAFSENVAECLKAGMNGHVAKPIDIKFVIKEIRKIKENKQ